MGIGLSDYEFQLNNPGITLNDDSIIPFVDIEKVSGLDNAPYRETIRDHEGTDGGFIDAEFEKGRDIILDGIIYGGGSNVEPYLDTIKANYAPVTAPIPFYFKAPGVSERLIYVKPRGVRYDWERARRLGITDAQFMLFAEDPRIYDSDLTNTTTGYGGDAGFGLAFAGLYDTFTRTTSSSLGTADSGHTYTLTGTSSDFSTNGTTARIVLTAATGTAYFATVNTVTAVNHWLFAQGLALTSTPTGGTVSQLLDVRVVDANNYYRCEIIRTTTSTCQVALIKVVAGTPTTLVAAFTVPTLGATQAINVRVEITQGNSIATGSILRAKVWAAGSAEPVAQTVEAAIDTSVTATGGTRMGVVRNASNTNVNLVSSIDGLQWNQGIGFNLDFGGGATPGGTTVTNNGNRPTPVQFIVTGPIDNPVITNTATGSALGFTISLTGSDTLTINTRDRTVYLNGNVNRRNTLTTPGWFFLNPGPNAIGFGGLTGTGSTLNIQFRSAWR